MIKTFFLKRLKQYFLILMIPSLVLYVFIFGMLSNSKIQAIGTASRNALENVNDTFDLITSNAFYQQDLMTLNPQLSLSLHKILLFSTASYTDYVFLNSMQTILDSTSKSQPFLHSIYLYLNDYDSFFSSQNGICSLNNFYDTSWHDIYRSDAEGEDTYIARRTIPPASSGSVSIDVMTIYQQMTYLNGVIVANIPVNTLLDNIRSALPTWGHSLLILNSDRNILVSDSVQETDFPAYADYFRDTFSFDASRAHQWGVIDNRLYLINSHYNDEYSLQFVLLTPLSSIVQTILMDLTWPSLIITTDFFIILFLAFFTTRSNFSQIRYVINLFDNAEKGILPRPEAETRPLKNEYDLIMSNVIRLFLNTTFLNSQLAEQRYRKQVAELTALQLQINPHFMINTLQTLNFEVQKMSDYRPSTASHMIENLSDILKYSLSPVDAPVSFADELNNVYKYTEIQKYRFPDSFLVYEDVEDAVLNYPFKRLILQPLVENSISHGIRPLENARKGYIKIRIVLKRQHIIISVIDNGAGITKERMQLLRGNLSSGTSSGCIGLDNVNKRLILNYGENSALRILSHEGLGTCVTFSITAP